VIPETFGFPVVSEGSVLVEATGILPQTVVVEILVGQEALRLAVFHRNGCEVG